MHNRNVNVNRYQKLVQRYRLFLGIPPHAEPTASEWAAINYCLAVRLDESKIPCEVLDVLTKEST